jgi:uncharacterized membrane protein
MEQETKQQLPSLEEIRKATAPIRNVNIAHKEQLTRLERIATWITDNVGSMGFFFIVAVWTLGWLGWNSLAPTNLRFDSYPAFALWLFISNIIQIALLPLLMVGQNLQDRNSEIRAQVDFEVNVRTEKEVEAIFAYLEHQNELLNNIMEQVRSNDRSQK